MGSVLFTNDRGYKQEKAKTLFDEYVKGDLLVKTNGLFENTRDVLSANEQHDKWIAAEHIFKYIACCTNYADESKFNSMLEKLPLLSTLFVYQGYTKYLFSFKGVAKKYSEFKTSCKRIFHPKESREAYLSVLAYTLATNSAARPGISSLYRKNKTTAIQFIANKFASRETVKYNLDIEGFYYYRMALSLCLAAETDPALQKQVRDIIKKTMPTIESYVRGLGAYLGENDYADGFVGPFLFIFQTMFHMREDLKLILRLIISIHELIQDCGYKLHDSEAVFIAGLFFALNSSGTDVASTGANILLSKCRNTLKSISKNRYDNELVSFLNIAAFLARWRGLFVVREASDTFEQLRQLPKRKIKSILENFIVSKFFFINGDVEQRSCSALVEETMDSMLDSFKGAFNKWNNEYYLDKESDYDLDISNEKEGSLGQLSVFLNLLAEHICFELYLSQVSERDIEFDAEEEQKSKEESIFKQKYADMEKECRELRNMVVNKKALMSENAELKKQIAELMHQTSQHSDEKERNKKELVGLRNLVYELSNSVDQELSQENKDISTEEMGEYLNKNVRGVIIGGHVNVHNKLDKYIPKWKKYSPESKITPSTFANKDIVVIFSDYLSHGSYFQAIDCIRKSECKLLYIHNVNMDYVMSKIYNTCREEIE